MKINFTILLFLLFLNVNASSIKISSYGFDSKDCTTFVWEAFNSSFDTVIFDKKSSYWYIKSSKYFDLKDKTIIFEDGVVVAAIKDSFADVYATLFSFIRCQNVSLIGYGAELIMNKAEYIALNDSEYRHGIAIENCLNFTIKGLIIRDTGGDGIYVGGANYWQDNLTYSKDILIEDVQCINNYRQGMSITSVENMQVINCHFSKTKGTLPEAGVDVEPFETYQRIINLEFRNCKFFENNWSGLAIALVYMDSTSMPVSIEVNDCLFKDNGSEGHPYGNAEIFANTEYKSPVKGNVAFNRCAIDGSDWSAFYTRKTEASYRVKFKDCVFNNVSRKQKEYNEPIFLEVPDYDNPSPYIGGIDFENVYISYPTDFPFLRIYGWETLAGVKNITGNLTIVANSVLDTKIEKVANEINFDLKYKKFLSLPSLSSRFESNGSVIEECKTDEKISFGIVQKVDYPVLLNISTNGGATQGNDYNLLTQAIVIPSGQLTNGITIKARQDNQAETNEEIFIDILSNDFVVKNTDDILIYTIEDCLEEVSVGEVDDKLKVSYFPNPSSDFIYINSNKIIDEITIYNISGVPVKSGFAGNIKNMKISIADLFEGNYILTLRFSKNETKFFKIVKM
jgi:effector-binding domain-containing protein